MEMEIIKKINTMFFWIASNPEALGTIGPDATVEAEFGDITVPGRIYTLAHHGANSGDPCPCLAQIPKPLPDGSNVGVSHFDLDTLGGILRLAGYLPGGGDYGGTVDEMFWRLAAEIDVRGYHHFDDILLEIQADTGNIGICKWVSRAYHAWCAWSAEHRYYPPKHNEAVDCTGFIREAVCFVLSLLDGNKKAFRKGDEWLEAQGNLDKESFVNIVSFSNFSVIVRKHNKFVNHLYKTYLYGAANFVFAHNLGSGTCVLSQADPSNVDCSEIMKELFGPDSGGKAGIAGSTRGKIILQEEFNLAVDRLVKILADRIA